MTKALEINFKTNTEGFLNDYMDVVRAFYPYVEVSESARVVELNLKDITDKSFVAEIVCDFDFFGKKKEDYCKVCDIEECSTSYEHKSQVKRYSKILLYQFLSDTLNVKLPYGSLTGIRPTKLYHERQERNKDCDNFFENVLSVSKEKVELIRSIVDNQKGIYNHNEMEVDVFVNIPICTSRCSYCSFISAELFRVKKLIDPYFDLLLKEIEMTKKIVKDNGYKVRSIYVGGGTPTSVDDVNFAKLVKALDFDTNEFTIEAGRPDTITKEKLEIMANGGVNRISINPQTFSQKTLELIGRKHNVDDIYKVYELARNYKFDINMDLIAMLPNESFEDFMYSVNETIKLDPENITVHTLALKKGSKLMDDSYDNFGADMPKKMVDFAYESILAAGYAPYYMYKQKHASGNLDNIGYCKKGKACIYNIDIMEETNSIIANGAGGISKRINNENHSLERLPNAKGLEVYLEREKDILEKKYNFFLR